MQSAADEVLRAFLAVAPDELGNKKTRKLLRKMYDRLGALTPSNGIGPQISLRRDAMQMLETAVRGIDAAE